MSYDKPAYLSEIETVPKYNFDYETYKRESKPIVQVASSKSILEDLPSPKVSLIKPAPAIQTGAGKKPEQQPKPVPSKVDPPASRMVLPQNFNVDSSESNVEIPQMIQERTPQKKVQERKPSKEPAARKSTMAGEQIKNLDLLSLKKLVIEDLKNEIQVIRQDP